MSGHAIYPSVCFQEFKDKLNRPEFNFFTKEFSFYGTFEREKYINNHT